jgi:hypothetical protein
MNKKNIKKLNIMMTISLWLMAVGLLLFFFIRFYRYAYPSSTDLNNILQYITQSIAHGAIIMIQNIINLYNFVSINYFKSAIFLFTIVYLLISFFAYPVGPMFKSGSFDFSTKTGNVSPDSRTAFLLVTNVLWILLGVALIIGFFNVTLQRRNTRNPYPTGSSLFERFKWTLYKSFFDLKVFSAGVSVLAFVIGLLYIIGKFQFVSLSLSVLLQISSIIALLFMAFKWVNSRPRIKRTLENNFVIKLLYHIVFALPCFVGFTGEGIYKNFKNTPSVVWLVFLAEILFIVLYYFLPIIRDKFYTTNLNSRSGKLTKQQAQSGISSAITITDRKINNITSQLDVDWKKIIKNKLYKSKNETQLKAYLKYKGFKEHYEEKDNITSLIKNIFIAPPPLTLTAAITFIQTNTPLLKTLKTEKKEREHNYKHFSKKADQVFTSKILLKEPTYTDKIKILGSFENLKGDLNTYNYQYSLSAWIFLHEQPPSKSYANNKFTSIINYGNKPNILFNPSEGKLQIINQQGKKDTEVIYQTNNILLQKWNNIVVNYEGGTIDIFLNGNLVASKNNIIPYMSYDKITLGNKDGVSGGASAIIYYDGPLSKRQIEFFYNNLKDENPPIV